MNLFAKCAIFFFLLSYVNALFEDQIHKFDWRRQQIGALDHAYLDLNSFQPHLLVSTHENVLASICPKTGDLLWRQVLEDGSRGDIKLMQTASANNDASNTAAARPNTNFGFDLLTVQGHAPALVRGWNANNGMIEWEWSMMPLQADKAADAFWIYTQTLLYHVLPIWKSHLEVTQYFATTGRSTGLTGRISAPWINRDNCVLSGNYYACLEGNQLITLDLTESQPQILEKTLPEQLQAKRIQALKGASGILVVDRHLVSVQNEEKEACEALESNDFLVGVYNHRRVIVQADVIDKLLHIKAHYADDCKPVNELSYSLPYPEHNVSPLLKTFDCKTKRINDGKGCLFLFATEDEAILAVQQGKLRWMREEALANVIAAEFIDLPLADDEGTLEREMKGKSGDIVSAFVRRVTTQSLQIKSIFLHVLGLAPPPTATQRAGLVRDSFGLHKMLILLTRCGKVFGVDNLSGKHHWQLYLPHVGNFENDENMRLIVQRTAKHFPLQPLCTIVGRDKITGNGVLYRFNPIVGTPAEGGLLKLEHKIKQLSLLAESDTDFVKGILVIDADNNVDVYPEHAKNMANGLYIYTADRKTSTLDGFYVRLQKDKLITIPLWNVRLGGHNSEQRIIAVASKNPLERVHSQGRVLGDRSVLYKYINPNLVAVFTEATDSIHKFILNVYLVDVVSGSVVFSMTHRKVHGPLNVVHAENWLAYSYYNEKVRRTEITTVELYEGKTQANSTVWSSLNAPPMPLVERQSYIMPVIVETMRETITERGITNKDVLIGTSSGAIVETPWAFLDPRRPTTSTTQGREEGAIPYIPELPLPTESIINYNQTIARLRYIYTAPSGLESTCLVVATGLDIYVTRVAPSKTFDLLKEDFDYVLITVVLVVLTTASLVVKHLASRKILKQAWK